MALAPKTVFITGASRGLGLEYVAQLVKLANNPLVIASCRNPNEATGLQRLAADHSNLKVIKLDVEKSDEINSAYTEVETLLAGRGLNLFINNVGVYRKNYPSNLRTVERDDMNWHFDVNCTVPIILTQKFLPLLEKAVDAQTKALSYNNAGVVFMSSIMSSIHETSIYGHGDSFLYKCSKSALNMAMVMIARELGAAGILILGLHPGWVQTDMGGPHAPLTRPESIKQILSLLGSADKDRHGNLWIHDGKPLAF